MSSGSGIRVGVISDTHGLLRPQAVAALRGSQLIIHAGDVGSPDILSELGALAPTYAVRGNVDTQAWAARLPATEAVEIGELRAWVLHIIGDLDIDPVDPASRPSSTATPTSHRSSGVTACSFSIRAVPAHAASACR